MLCYVHPSTRKFDIWIEFICCEIQDLGCGYKSLPSYLFPKFSTVTVGNGPNNVNTCDLDERCIWLQKYGVNRCTL